MQEPCAEAKTIKPIFDRRAGILLHPTSLPSGCLDGDVERWLDLLQNTGVKIWQILPLVIPDETGSPYQSCSAFAINPALLSDQDRRRPVDASEVEAFIGQESAWLADFALYTVLKDRFNSLPWYKWDPVYCNRSSNALQKIRQEESEKIQGIIKEQFRLQKRWQDIRSKANAKDIKIFGDMPIFVALDSADVWSNQDQFLLDENHKPRYVAGVPPDYFSETGQRWGNPHYNWERMRHDNFSWWRLRLKRMFEWFDIVRLDHFRGLEAVWMIPQDSETAVNGHWEKVPGQAMLTALQDDYPNLPIVAEDLGFITEEVRQLRQQFGLPGMAVLHFAFDHFEDNPHKPKNYTANTVAYTGTHDNNTTNGWFSHLDFAQRSFVSDILQLSDITDPAQQFISVLLDSRASLVIFPMQDVLGLGEEARLNTPGTTSDNWQWRLDWGMISDSRLQSIKQGILHAGR